MPAWVMQRLLPLHKYLGAPDVIARSIARMSFRIHYVPEFHFYAIADGASDVLKRGRRWRGFDPAAAEARDAAPLFEFFRLNTG